MAKDKNMMADDVNKALDFIVAGVDEAEGVFDLTRLGGMAEGFAMGLNCMKSMQAAEIEQVEILLTQAFDRRIAELRHP
jgi:hypothetical protein